MQVEPQHFLLRLYTCIPCIIWVPMAGVPVVVAGSIVIYPRFPVVRVSVGLFWLDGWYLLL